MAENLTAVRFFHHASSGEGIVKIPSRACATARNVWSSQDVKITKIAICQDQAYLDQAWPGPGQEGSTQGAT